MMNSSSHLHLHHHRHCSSSSISQLSQSAVDLSDTRNTWYSFVAAMKKVGVNLRQFRVTMLKYGDPHECVRLLRYLLLGVSVEVALQVVSLGGGGITSDKKFISTTFRYLHNQSKYFPIFSVEQFQSKGFVQHKLLLLRAAALHVFTYLEQGGPRIEGNIDEIGDSETNLYDAIDFYQEEVDQFDNSHLQQSEGDESESNASNEVDDDNQFSNKLNSPESQPRDLHAQNQSASHTDIEYSNIQSYQNNSSTGYVDTPETPQFTATTLEAMIRDIIDKRVKEEVAMIQTRLKMEYSTQIYLLENRVKSLENSLHEMKKMNNNLK